MKSKLNGFRFKTWLYFTLFAVGILGLLWVLQISSMKPYFRSVKESSIRNVRQNIVNELQSGVYNVDYFDEIARMNDMCFSIYDSQARLISFHDGVGLGCYLNNTRIPLEDRINPILFIEEINQNLDQSYIAYINVGEQNNDMVVYGSKVFMHLSGYYILINSYVEPISDGVFIIQDQFILLSAAVLLLSTVVSYLISRGMSKPIVEMRKTAKMLGEGNYNIDFTSNSSSYDELDELASTLNYATEQLSKTDELRRDLVANVSHDIKTPLTMIKAYAEMIFDLSGEIKEKREEHLKVIINEVNYLDRLVSDMLELSKVQSMSSQLNKEKIDITELAKSIIALFELEKESSKIKIVLEGIEDAFVFVDSVKIGQVLFNFIGNAVKFVGSDHLILVRISDLNNAYRVAVIDHGIGIASSEIDLIWDRYHRINKHHSRNKEGSGLGLAISKAILESHHSYFGVESEVDKGSTFFFDLVKYRE